MILADSSVWIDHFRKVDPVLLSELRSGNVLMHPFVVAELVLGSLQDRMLTVEALDQMRQVETASLPEVRRMVEVHALHGKGIGVVDAHLLASTLITRGTRLWTRDKRLRNVAEQMGIAANLP